jgi:hypothetical protein
MNSGRQQTGRHTITAKQRSCQKAMPHHLQVDEGETPEDALVRELHEELNIQVGVCTAGFNRHQLHQLAQTQLNKMQWLHECPNLEACRMRGTTYCNRNTC